MQQVPPDLPARPLPGLLPVLRRVAQARCQGAAAEGGHVSAAGMLVQVGVVGALGALYAYAIYRLSK
jgi:hypothetical protein